MPMMEYPEDRKPLGSFSALDYTPKESEIDADTMSVIGSAIRQSGVIGSNVSNKMAGVDTASPDGLTGEEMWKDIEGTRYEPHWDRFTGLHNRPALHAMMSQIDMEDEDRRIIDSAGWWGTAATFGAAFFDLPTLIPGGAVVRGATTGATVLRSALQTGAAGALAGGVSEVALQQSQQTRTGTESAIGVGAGAIFGALLGAGAGTLLSVVERRAAMASINKAMGRQATSPEGQSAGAAAVDKPVLEDFDIAKGAKTVGAVQSQLNPLLRATQSPSAVHRSVMADLAETGFYLEKNVRGDGNIAVESAVKYWDRGALTKGLSQMRSIYNEARKAPDFNMSREEFRAAVSKAMRRGDEGENEAVSKAAATWRNALFEPLKNEAVEVGLLPADVNVKTATSYLTRIWNAPRLNAEEARFKATVRPWLDDQLQQLEFKADEIRVGNKVVDAEKLREAFDKVDERVQGFEGRLGDRQGIRQRKGQYLERLRQTRLDVMKERAPAELVKMLRGADENAVMIDTVKEARAAARSAGKKQAYHERFPVLSLIKSKGGVRVGSKLDAELRSMGVTPKTHPGLFRKEGGVGDVDNFVKDQEAIFTDLPDDGSVYVDPRSIMASIREELGGNPLRSPDDQMAAEALEQIDRAASEWLERVGLPEGATVKEVRDFITRVLGAENNLEGMDSRISGLERELGTFDEATDKLTNERSISGAEARDIQARLDALEAELDGVSDLANSSPRVGLVVDYAKVRRDLFKSKLKERNLSRRVDALKRLKAEGDANDDILAELAAKEIDLGTLRADIAGMKTKADKLEPMVPKVRQEIPEFVSPEDRADYVNGIVDDIFTQLTGRANQGMPSYDMTMAARGPMKERTFNIPDHLIEDFLEHDIELIARRYARVMAADVELARMDKRLGGDGKPTLKSQLDRVKTDYQALRDTVHAAEMDPGARTKALAELAKREKSDVEDIAGVRDLLRGQYKVDSQHTNFAKVLRSANTFNYIRTLGGVLVSSLSDVVRPAMVNGLSRYMGEGIAPLLTNLKAVKLAVEDAKTMGAVTEQMLQSRIATMAELADPYAHNSPFERLLDNMGAGFSKMTLLPWWNDMHKSIASVLTQNRVLKNVLSTTTAVDAPVAKAAPDLTPDAFYAQPARSLDDLYAAAGKWQTDLEGAGADIAKATGATFKSKGLKKKETAASKVARKGYDDASELTDVVRGGFVVNTPAQADDVIAKLAERYDVLDEGWVFKDTGYFDRKALVRFDDGTVGEVQLWEPNLRKAKSEGGQKLYQAQRELDPSSPEAQRINAEQEKLYSAAMAEAGEAWSTLGGSSGPNLLKRSRQASSDINPAVSRTSQKSTLTQGVDGLSMASASDLPSTAGRLSQFTNFMSDTSDGSVPRSGIANNSDYSILGAAERRYMGYVGIDEVMAARIADQFHQFGSIEGNVHIPGIENWTDDAARRAFAAAINKDVDATIVTKSVADVPLFMHTPAGRTLLQFKSFALASNQRALMRGLQDGPGSVMTGVIGMSAVGMLTYWLKSLESGRLKEDSWIPTDNPGTWIAEGLDRSGLLATAFEINSTFEALGGPGFYAAAAAAGQMANPGADASKRASRFANRNAFGALLGPSFQLGTDAAQLLGVPLRGASDSIDDDPSTNPRLAESDINRAFKMVPFLTLPYFRWLIEGGFRMDESETFKGVKPELKELVK